MTKQLNVVMNRVVLIITDRPDSGQDLQAQISSAYQCCVMELGANADCPNPVAAIVTDVSISNLNEAQRLRLFLSRYRASKTPIVCLLRENTYLALTQANSFGATTTVSAAASKEEITAVLRRLLNPTGPAHDNSLDQPVDRSAKQVSEILMRNFAAAAQDQRVDMTEIAVGADLVRAIIAEAGIRRWLDVVWNHDDCTYQHCLMVAGLAAAFAAHLGFRFDDQIRLGKAAVLHDIGKAKIPYEILSKPGALSPEEKRLVQTHARAAYELLDGQGDCDADTLDVVLHHHEMLDGSGYPEGLIGDEIGDLVRLVTICDIYGALLERRSYKEPIPPSQAFEILQSMDGKLEAPLVRGFAPVAAEVAAGPKQFERQRAPF